MKSRILEFIKNNPDTWEEKLNEKFIRTNHCQSEIRGTNNAFYNFCFE